MKVSRDDIIKESMKHLDAKREKLSAEDKRQAKIASMNSDEFKNYLDAEPKKRKTKRQQHIDDEIDEYDEAPIMQKHIAKDKGLTAVPASSNVVIPDLVKPRSTHEAGKVIQNQVARPPMDESGDVDLNKLFSSEVGNESDVVKELFSSENIKVKTELTQDEIKIISRLELQASMTQNFFLAKILKEYETLLVSKQRKSRQEFVNSFRGIGDQASGATAFSKIGNIFNKDKV
jgi:hypothetical protein